jgi:hypothetical protein
MPHDANGGRYARITSHLIPYALGAILGTSRKSTLRLAERDIKGGEYDCEGEGELEHVGPNRCSDVDICAIEKGPIYPLQPREGANVRHSSTRLRCCVGASMAFV